MAEEIVELVRSGYEDANRGDYEGLLSRWDSEVVIYDATRPNLGDPRGEWHGHEGFRKMAEDWVEGIEGTRFELEEVIDAGERVFVQVRGFGRGHASGIELEDRRYHVFTVRDGSVIRFEVHSDRAEARAAAGLAA